MTQPDRELAPTTVSTALDNPNANSSRPVSGKISKRASSKPRKPKTRRMSAFSSAFAKLTVADSARDRVRPVLILGMIYLETSPGIEHIRSVIGPKMLRLPRFRSVVRTKSSGGVHYEEVPLREVDMDYHFVHVKETHTQESLDRYLESLYGVDMDLSRPLWQFHYVESMDTGNSVLVAVVNHCIADGVTMVHVLQDVVMDKPTAGQESDPSSDAKHPKPSGTIRRPKPSVGKLDKVNAFFGGLFRSLFGIVMPADPPSRLKIENHRRPGSEKACAFSEQIDLDKVKEIKDRFPGSSINDIVLSLMTMALRAYFVEIGDPIMQGGKTIRGNFPYDLRKPGINVVEEAFGNQIATPSFRFPIHYNSYEELVEEIKRQVELIKVSPEPYLNYKVTTVASKLNASFMTDLLLDVNGKVTAMLSNVRGPPTMVTVAGQKVVDLRFYAYAPIGLYFGLLTYNNKLTASVVLDKQCEPDAHQLAKHWKPEFDKFYSHVMQSQSV